MNTTYNGRLLPSQLFSENSIALFKSKVLESKTRFWNGTPCQEWIGKKDRNGYGKLTRKWGGAKYDVFAHRFSFLCFVGTLENELCVLHRCDNKPCVNPLHLFKGTLIENTQDMVSKNRQSQGENASLLTRGENNASSKLTDSLVKEIRKRSNNGERGTTLAKVYGVTSGTIYHIISRRNWKFVN